MQLWMQLELTADCKEFPGSTVVLSFPSEVRNKPCSCRVPISSNLQHPRKGGRRLMGLGKHGKCRKLALPRMLGKLQINQAPPGLCKH